MSLGAVVAVAQQGCYDGGGILATRFCIWDYADQSGVDGEGVGDSWEGAVPVDIAKVLISQSASKTVIPSWSDLG
jgi:hypothetical protein